MHEPNRQFLKRLREETNDAHVAVEDSVRITERIQSLKSYQDLLERFYGFYFPAEAVLKDFYSASINQLQLSQRLKSSWLLQDLEYFGLNKAQIKNLPLCEHLPKIKDLNDLLGYLYVVEGSSLGSQIISKMIKEANNIDSDTGGRFFQAYGPETGLLWRSFGDFVCRYITTKEQEDTIIQSAKNTFECFESWIK